MEGEEINEEEEEVEGENNDEYEMEGEEINEEEEEMEGG